MASNRAVLPDKRPQIATPGHFGDLEVIRVDIMARTATFQVRGNGVLSTPETTAPLSMIRPLTEEDSSKFWNMLVDDLMRVLRVEGHYPAFVKGYEVETGEDSTGDPALYITILVSPEQKYSQATVSRWNRFSNLLLDRLIGLRLQRYPYVRIGEKRRGK
ncbi:MAG: hypothetical protein ABR987_07550 [Terracidiphilus sp.]|jgi:hypothetical protein